MGMILSRAELLAQLEGDLSGWLIRFVSPKGLADGAGHVTVPILVSAGEKLLESLATETAYRVATFAWLHPGEIRSPGDVPGEVEAIMEEIVATFEAYLGDGQAAALVRRHDPGLCVHRIRVRFGDGPGTRSERLRQHIESTCRAFESLPWREELVL